MASARSVGPGFSPLDNELALLPGSLTPRLQESLVRLSTWLPSFAKAAAELAWFTHVDVGRETARRLTEAAGSVAVELQTASAEHLLQHHPAPPPGAEQLVFSVDGAMVPLVGGQWTEVRTLAVGTVVPELREDKPPLNHATQVSYFSRRTDSVTFTDQAVVELHRRGLETAGRVAAVVDGAEWCQQFIDVHAPQAVRILDFPHAAEYISAIGATVGPNGPLKTSAEQAQLMHELKHAGPERVLAELQALLVGNPNLTELPTQVAYLRKRTAQMQYPQYVADGWPIGSGMVESANKLVVEDRLKGAGMHWADANVNPLLALRSAVCNDRWDEVWGEIEAEQRRRTAARRRARHQKRHEAGQAAQVVAPVPRPASAAAHRPAPSARPSDGRSAVSHPWRKPWSIRQQRKLADAR